MPLSLSIVRKFHPKVNKVVNGTQTITIEVTETDGGRKGRKDHEHCAIAEACKRAFKVDGAIVARRTAYLIKGNIATRYELPQRLANEVMSYDRGGGFAAGEYVLRPPRSPRRPPAHSPGTGQRTGALVAQRVAIPGVRQSLMPIKR